MTWSYSFSTKIGDGSLNVEIPLGGKNMNVTTSKNQQHFIALHAVYNLCGEHFKLDNIFSKF